MRVRFENARQVANEFRFRIVRRYRRNLRQRMRESGDLAIKEIRRELSGRYTGKDRKRRNKSKRLGSFSGALASAFSYALFQPRRGRRKSWRIEIRAIDGLQNLKTLIHEFGITTNTNGTIRKYPRRRFLFKAVRRITPRVRAKLASVFRGL